jgi:hypothetical protein
MTETTHDAPAPKKRSLFKRAAWQDSPKTDEDIFSHSKDFKYIVAEQTKLEVERKKKAEEERKQKLASHSDRKRRKVSSDHDEGVRPGSSSGSPTYASRTGSKAYAHSVLSTTLIATDSIPDVAKHPSRPYPHALNQTRSLPATMLSPNRHFRVELHVTRPFSST